MKKIFSSRIIVSALLVAFSIIITVVVVRATREQSELKRLHIENKTVVSAFKDDTTKKMKNLVVKNDLQKYGIEVITPTDPSFGRELTQYFGNDNSLISLSESAKPFVFFIKNNSQKEIVGVSLRWKFSINNRNDEFPQSEANPGVLMGMKTLDPKMVGKTSLINSKSVKLFTYFKDIIASQIAVVSTSVNNSLNKNNYSGDFNQRNQLILNAQKEKLLNGYDDFSVAIDGIIFNDGTFIGPDQNLFFYLLGAQIQATKDTLMYLKAEKSTGKENKDILDGILSQASNISENLAGTPFNSPTAEQITDYSYKTYQKNLKREITMKRSAMSDDSIIEQFLDVHISPVITLHKEDDF